MHFLILCLMLMWATLAIGREEGKLPTPTTVKQAQQGSSKEGSFPVITLTVGMTLIRAEVAANKADREQGLMFRKSLGHDEGMLFVFDETAAHCFWMKNTEIPLSIAFINDDGAITDIDEMQAGTTNHHCPTHAGRYALEMNKGWFSLRGIQPGAHISGLPY